MQVDDRDSGGGKPSDVLTDAQLACVRLVHKGPSKVIARYLDISHHTVDDHLRQAMRRLGAQTRHEAAEIVAAWDAGHPQDLMPQVERLVSSADTAKLVASSAGAGTPVPPGHVLREQRAEFGSPDLRSFGMARLTQYWFGNLFRDLTGPKRMQGALKLALIVSFIVLVLVGVGNTIQISLLTYSANS